MKRIAMALLVLAAWGLASVSLGVPDQCKRCAGIGKIVCPQCEGNWQNATVLIKCERRGGIGCDGQGYRPCFKCKGKDGGQIRCPRCGGKKYVTILTRKGSIVLSEKREACPECRGKSSPHRSTGLVDCPKCQPLWKCSACDRFFQHKPQYCPCSPPDYRATAGKTTIIELTGQVVCPKCKGKGEYEKRGGKCPYCTRGHATCPQCFGSGRGSGGG